MSRKSKIALGFATIAPFVGLLVTFITMIATPIIGSLFQTSPSTKMNPVLGYTLFFPFILGIIALIFSFLVCWIDVGKQSEWQNSLKIKWKIFIFAAPVWALPIYWYIHVWGEPTRSGERL